MIRVNKAVKTNEKWIEKTIYKKDHNIELKNLYEKLVKLYEKDGLDAAKEYIFDTYPTSTFK